MTDDNLTQRIERQEQATALVAERLDRIEATVSGHDARFDALEAKIDGLAESVRVVADGVNYVNSQVGGLVTLVGDMDGRLRQLDRDVQTLYERQAEDGS